MPPASWPARANRRVQTIPIGPVLRYRPVTGPPLPRLGDAIFADRKPKCALMPQGIDSRSGCGLGCTGPWILAVVDRSPSGGSDDPHPIPDVYRGNPGRPGPVLFTLDVDGERFAIGQAGDGGTTYDWLSGPNKGYGFASSGTPNRPVEEHRESIRVFLAMIDPNTGYIGDD